MVIYSGLFCRGLCVQLHRPWANFSPTSSTFHAPPLQERKVGFKGVYIVCVVFVVLELTKLNFLKFSALLQTITSATARVEPAWGLGC